MLALICAGKEAVINLLFLLLQQAAAPEDFQEVEAEEGLHRREGAEEAVVEEAAC